MQPYTFFFFLQRTLEKLKQLIMNKNDGDIVKEELFARDRVNEGTTETTKENNVRMNNKEDIPIHTIDDVDHFVPNNDVTLENGVTLKNFNSVDNIPLEFPMPFSAKQSSQTTRYKSKKRKLEDEESSSLKIMSCVHEVADAIREGNMILKESNIILERVYQCEYT